METTTDFLDKLYQDYIQERDIPLHKHQFIHLLKIYPSLVVLMSDGIVDKEERLVMNIQASKLGYDHATEDFETYLKMVPDTQRREEIEELLAEMAADASS